MTEALLYTQDVEAARSEIEQAGGHVLHVLTPTVLVADLLAPADLLTCVMRAPTDLDPMSIRLAEAWQASRSKPRAGPGIPWDSPSFEPPDGPPD